MARRCPIPITAETFYALPDGERKTELVRGYMVSEPLPRGRHGRVASNIDYALQKWARRTGAGIVYTCDTGFVLARDPDTVRGPDVAFVARERYALVDDDTWFVTGPPDLAVEVLSPGNRRTQVQAKVTDYLAAGAQLVWVVDPLRRTITAYDANSSQLLGQADELVAPDVLPGFRLSLESVFAKPWEMSR